MESVLPTNVKYSDSLFFSRLLRAEERSVILKSSMQPYYIITKYHTVYEHDTRGVVMGYKLISEHLPKWMMLNPNLIVTFISICILSRRLTSIHLMKSESSNYIYHFVSSYSILLYFFILHYCLIYKLRNSKFPFRKCEKMTNLLGGFISRSSLLFNIIECSLKITLQLKQQILDLRSSTKVRKYCMSFLQVASFALTHYRTTPSVGVT